MTLVTLTSGLSTWVADISRYLALRYRDLREYGQLSDWVSRDAVPEEIALKIFSMIAEISVTHEREYAFVTVFDAQHERASTPPDDNTIVSRVGGIEIRVGVDDFSALGRQGRSISFEYPTYSGSRFPEYVPPADVDLTWLDATELVSHPGYITGLLTPIKERFLEAGGTEFTYEESSYSVDFEVGTWVFNTETGVATPMPEGDLAHQAWLAVGQPTLEQVVGRARARRVERVRASRRQASRDEEMRLERERLARREESQQRLETFLRTARSTIDKDKEVIPLMPFVPHGLASSRRWGIEVESGGARGVDAPDEWDRKSDGSLRSAWEGYVEREDFEPYDEEREINRPWSDCVNFERHNPVLMVEVEGRGWVPSLREDYIPATDCQACGALTTTVRVEPRTITHTRRGDDCAEFVSPILTSMHSRGLEHLTGELSKQPQNDSAGVHVHVEANDLTPHELNTLIYGYAMIEPLIEASYRRERRDYCASTPPMEVTAAARKAKSRLDTEIPYGERYRSVNMNSLSRHGTVEFRAMGPVYNYDHLIRWAMFCREMVNVVKGGATVAEFGRVAGSWDGLMKLFLKYGKEYARAVVHERTGETGEWAKLEKRGNVTAGEIDQAIETDFAAWANALTGGALTEAQYNLVRSLDDLRVAV